MTVEVPCGRTLGHGKSCSEGHLCGQCGEIIRLRKQATAAMLSAPILTVSQHLYTALSKLVDLKLYKDIHGKDKNYLAARPQAWAQAKEVIEQIRGGTKGA